MVETEPRRSYRALHFFIVIIFLLLGGQLFRLQVLDSNYYKEQAKDNRERQITLKPDRGVIYDRNGLRLVVNNPSYSVAVTAADVPDINCAAGALDEQVQTAQVFKDMAKKLNTSYVLVVKPSDLPKDKVGEVANRLSVLLQTDANLVRPPLFDAMQKNPTSQYLFSIRTDVTEAQATAITGQLNYLPGIRVYNELEFNFVTRFGNCLTPVVVKRGLDYNTMLQLDSDHTQLPGMSIVSEPVRTYTDGTLFSHLLGYVGPISQEAYEAARNIYAPDDKVGKTGLEATLEDQLRGTKGVARVVVNSKERVVTQISAQQPITGNNVTLTIDSQLQKAVTTALQGGITAAKVQAGVAIVMRVDNGQILSMVSLPSYDNNLFSLGISQKDFDTLNTDPTLPMFNRAVGGAYPPGSTFKMVTASAALQENVVNRNTQIKCPGFIQVPYTWSESTRNTFNDWNANGHGIINVVQALTQSSDVFFYIVSGPHQEDRRIHQDNGPDLITWTRYYEPWASKPIEFNGLGIDRLHKYAAAFGEGQKTGIELPGEVAGLAPDPSWKLATYPDNPWSMGDTLVTAIGQGYNLMTPLQLVNMTAAVANGGTLYKPQLVDKITDWSGNVVQDFKSQVLEQVPVSPENLAIVREGMHDVVADKVNGTAYRMTIDKVAGIQVGGKTGTAEYGDPIGKKNGKDVRRSHAWFTAFAPYDKPEIAVVVLLEGGQESLEGSTFAVPVTDQILKAYFHVVK